MFDLKHQNPEIFNQKTLKKRSIKMFKMATGTDQLFNIFFSSQNLDIILSEAQKGLADFKVLRENYFLYE